MVNIIDDFLPPGLNWSDELLVPQGVVVHSTATPGASGSDEDKYFHGANRDASAHYFVDWNNVVKIVRLNKVAWHAGPTANHKYLGVEFCETSDPALWARVLSNGLDLLHILFTVYSWPVDYVEPSAEGRHLYSHAQTSALWRETDHQDPVVYFASHGYNMSLLASDLQKRLAT